MKLEALLALTTVKYSRSREGAWIEIIVYFHSTYPRSVAPARERGLKSRLPPEYRTNSCRSREGAWIEIWVKLYKNEWLGCRSREGAWIEMSPPR